MNIGWLKLLFVVPFGPLCDQDLAVYTHYKAPIEKPKSSGYETSLTRNYFFKLSIVAICVSGLFTAISIEVFRKEGELVRTRITPALLSG